LNANSLIVTGKDTYKFFNLTESYSMKCSHNGLSRREEN